jgi:hypothetical protein
MLLGGAGLGSGVGVLALQEGQKTKIVEQKKEADPKAKDEKAKEVPREVRERDENRRRINELETELWVFEHESIEKLAKAREKVIKAEAAAREYSERASNEPYASMLAQLRQEVARTNTTLDEFRQKAGAEHPIVNDLKERAAAAVRKLEKYGNEVDAARAKYRQSATEAAIVLFRAEEEFKIVERHITHRRRQMQIDLEVAQARRRELEGRAPVRSEPGAANTAELEQKLDTLIREVGDLKREVQKLSAGKK